VLAPAHPDLARVAHAIDQRFPELATSAPLTVLGSGVNSIVTQTSGAIVLRIGRGERSYEGYSLEHRLLPAIAPLIPVAVPSPGWLIAPCDDFPCGAIGYRRIEGRALTLEHYADIDKGALAEAIAALLAALHRIERNALPSVPTAGPHERRVSDLELYAATVPALREHLSPEDYERFDAFWRSYVEDPRMMEFDVALTHGDLWYGNLLIDDDGRLAAVLDWEIARVGDRARDFAGLKYFGTPFVESVLERYARHGGATDAALLSRLEKIMVMRELYGFAGRWKAAVSVHFPGRSSGCCARSGTHFASSLGQRALTSVRVPPDCRLEEAEQYSPVACVSTKTAPSPWPRAGYRPRRTARR
jgi:aminoglycoside 2''-phosphotransferase